jgi:peroxidase
MATSLLLFTRKLFLIGNILRKIRKYVNDIDLYAGGLSEAIVANQAFAVGPTFGCILMQQFADLKASDRFYYENGPVSSTFPGAFSLTQLSQIRNVTLAGLICNNYDLYQIQKFPFYLVNSK